MAPPNRPPQRELEVLAIRRVTPNMQRVTLGGAGLADFPAGSEGGYVKLRLAGEDGRLAVRTYTIREQRPDALDIDFALHAETATGKAGPATDWALSAQPGAKIEVGGPGPAKPLPAGMDFYLVAGDMTALPAIAVNLANLPANARGIAVIEVMDEADCLAVEKPDGVELRWSVVPQPGSAPATLAEGLRAVPWPAGAVYAWCASEFSAMQSLRAYLRDERGLGPDRLYISSYWKSGLTEEAHKLAKREDAEAQPA
ncbi:siderophore-interacting protein [Erythrobacter arachoides]|uniref:Siderophore-interacting protein n=1 Tax=Aurantiacibacter arachoides TaxID=1850444 RepID=A0A844ZZD3_9SPHN|nr:siderophore-interacting protein [Aurantiacibacter arachoides]MXO92610.1 siderophore-interacting protein [Aurantiacibacter arachoides]GGD55796.1 siderophore-interacting protein [Aurantiacibacter arachoides]